MIAFFNSPRAKLGLTAVCFLFGLAVVSQIRTETRIRSTINSESAADLAAIAGDLYDNNSALRAEVDKLVAERSAGAPAVDNRTQSEQRAELQRLREFNGVVDVSGSGIQLTVDAALRPTDLVDVINEFRNAGAEAIAVGGQRVIYSTVVAGTQDNLTVNGAPLVSPYVVKAIGDPDVLDRAIARKGGMLAYLRTTYPRASFGLTTASNLRLPPNLTPFGITPGS